MGRCKMANDMLINALKIINGYLKQNYGDNELAVIHKEINTIMGGSMFFDDYPNKPCSYEEMQESLSTLNEKETIRKNKGVYYTPLDVVKFILINSVKMACQGFCPNNLHVSDLSGIPCSTLCYDKTVYDPTCGSGVFLLAALELKLDLLDLNHIEVTKDIIKKVVESINGNDLNKDSVTITKIRLFLCVLYRHGAAKIKGLADVLNSCYKCYDYVEHKPNEENKYDIIIGNPPYIEDAKSESFPEKRYGNIYANVLENASLQLKPNGVLGFVIPLSYVSTPRMGKIRDELYATVPEQYILSYSDRPDCLFVSVHQKLCILFGRNNNGARDIYTGNYRYWYKEERHNLFNTAEVVKNDYVENEYIPKLGTKIDVSVYKRLIRFKTSIINLLEKDGKQLYLNMRATFWIKAFLKEHTGAEYKTFKCKNQDYAAFCMCLLNSSLFWWYWICVSDCWHITRKELYGFKVPEIDDFTEVNKLAAALEKRLEETKLYVGTKQTEYEYKHKECVDTIHQIDDYINALYGLSEEEGLYIKNFAYRYRIGAGVETNESGDGL
ncbi:MAG: SAM-dependent methyltransferase [Butyrivibrio sp.]|nr:SAM-dependent methyltransferase [Butyrivibrio sp.]